LVIPATRTWTYVHAAAAVTAAAAGFASSLAAAPNAQGIAGGGLALLMLAIAVIDARHFVIPDELNIAALVLAFIHAGIQTSETAVAAIALAVLRGTFLSLAFLGLRIGYRKLRNRDGIGLGDVKLAAVAGAWLGWQTMPIAVQIAALAALAAYITERYVLG